MKKLIFIFLFFLIPFQSFAVVTPSSPDPFTPQFWPNYLTKQFTFSEQDTTGGTVTYCIFNTVNGVNYGCGTESSEHTYDAIGNDIKFSDTILIAYDTTGVYDMTACTGLTLNDCIIEFYGDIGSNFSMTKYYQIPVTGNIHDVSSLASSTSTTTQVTYQDWLFVNALIIFLLLFIPLGFIFSPFRRR